MTVAAPFGAPIRRARTSVISPMVPSEPIMRSTIGSPAVPRSNVAISPEQNATSTAVT